MNYLEQNNKDIFKKFTDSELKKDLKNFYGKGRLYKFLNHYCEEEMFKCKGGRGSISPMEALQDNEVVNKIIEFTNSKPKFYVGKEVANVKSFFRNAGRIAQKVANFPVRQALEIYGKYTSEGDVIFDPSCGFGSRMSASILSGRHYAGTDPNLSLTLKLNEAGQYLKTFMLPKDIHFKIYEHGSEVFIPELENKVNFCFTSPPYFDLEVYGSDKGQSIEKFSDYYDWVDCFVKPTVNNCIKYTRSGGHIAINIKNMTSGKKYPLFDDFFRELDSNKCLEFIEILDIKQSSKRDYKGKHFTGVVTDYGVKEPVMVFKKK